MVHVSAFCSVEGCQNNAVRSGLCWGCYDRQRRGKPPSERERTRHRNRWDAVWDAIMHLTELGPEDREKWERAKQRVKVYARRWATGRR